jgi:hypothetical protein
VKRLLPAILLVVVVLAAIYALVLRDTTVSPRLISSTATAMIGSGSSAMGVAADGTVLPWLPLPADASLPQLPLTTPPKGPRLAGSALQQALVLGAAPAALRPYIESSFYGTSGVDVELKAGIELRFGDASQATRKWKATAAVIANPSVTSLDCLDLHAPVHPAICGSGHTLPPIP